MSDMTPEQAQALLDGIAYGDETLAASMLTARGINAIEAAAPDLARAYIAQAAEITRLRAAIDDVVCGRGMFGLNPADDLKWALDHLAAALSAYKEAGK